jgi:hypothetical protein
MENAFQLIQNDGFSGREGISSCSTRGHGTENGVLIGDRLMIHMRHVVIAALI